MTVPTYSTGNDPLQNPGQSGGPLLAAIISLASGFAGLILGVLIDESFGGTSFAVAPFVALTFVILSMGACVIYFMENKR